jgi:pathogen-inducible salicylic acid glucosyltransferase
VDPSSVVYVSFGSLDALGKSKWHNWRAGGRRGSNNYFLWVVRELEEAKLPKDFVRETSEKDLVIKWCPQLHVSGAQIYWVLLYSL